MPIITNQATLRTSVADWLNRTDLSNNQLDQFIEMGEAKIYEVLRIPPLEANESFTVLAANSSLAIPARFIEAIELKKSETGKDDSIVLSRVDEKAFSNNKIKNAYIRVGNSLIITDDNGEQNAEGTYVLRYYKADVSVGTLVDSVEVTDQFIIGGEYELILYSALAIGSTFLGDHENESHYNEMFFRKVEALNEKEKRAAIKGGSFSASVPYPGI
jgi:hypothetical protein